MRPEFRLRIPNSEFRIPNSEFRTPHSRRAISLLEVLVSMGILTIGLLSIASLLPLGLFQTQKAITEDAKAIIGHNAYREFRTRGMANPYTWINNNVGVLQRNPATNRDEPYEARFNPGVAIDPWGIAMMASASPSISGSDVFPLNRSDMGGQNEGPSLRRVTIRSVWPDHSGTNTQMNLQVNEELARNVFVSHDDTIWEKSNNPDGPAISRWETDVPSNPGVYFRREYAGNYSWLATMVPRYPPYGGAATLRRPLPAEWRVSIAIFHRRNPRVLFRDDGLSPERQIKVKNDDPPSDLVAFGLGGGQLLIDDPRPAEFKVGEWVLVSGWYDPSGNAQRNTMGTNACFLWYRVVSFDRSNDNNTQTYPTVTLAGPDWAWMLGSAATNNRSPCIPSHITILDGCVGVFEKTIHLEGPSMYAP
jgi:hypothetical protein